MTIDKRALREVAEKATPGNWRRTSSLFNGITVTPFSLCGEEVTLAHTVEKRDAEFIAAANPATMPALLDENIQLQREKDAIEAVALALRDDMRDAREKLEAAERSIAELESYSKTAIEFREAARDENRHLKLSLEAVEGRVIELEARQIALPQRLSPEGYHIDEAYMVDDAEGEYLDRDAVIEAISAAGIKVKGE
ncbi:ead/Ea22-like family protein [Salmonella enterica subsp. salamae]|nr:ead/Ea22-like family protein [Salmonella enterica subsp. salamae]